MYSFHKPAEPAPNQFRSASAGERGIATIEQKTAISRTIEEDGDDR